MKCRRHSQRQTSVSALCGAAAVIGWLLVAILADLLAPLDPLKSMTPLALPGATGEGGVTFWLGTDLLGRDILSRLIYGTRTVVVLSAVATLSAYVLGVGAGLFAGYVRGFADTALSFLANVMLSFPVLVLYIVVITAIGSSATNVVLAIAFGSAPVIFRVTRALTIDISKRDFVTVAIGQGEAKWRILASDILPNAAGPLTADMCLRFGYSAVAVGALGFLGLGPPPPTPDWGSMISDGRGLAIVYPHLIVFPCLAISSLMLAMSLVADGLHQLSLAR
jgi:peptide/nickel transport system permease protein